jgi:hypothetical protein
LMQPLGLSVFSFEQTAPASPVRLFKELGV